jgi:hypothetical protein
VVIITRRQGWWQRELFSGQSSSGQSMHLPNSHLLKLNLRGMMA